MKCKHSLAEKETACYADGLCPICLQTRIKRYRTALLNISAGSIGTNTVVSMQRTASKVLDE